ncbi:MAG: peptidase U32 [Deltaproteobacteria bacterium]|nr:peptidase U32 [Deltaproteobacteria bacterium]
MRLSVACNFDPSLPKRLEGFPVYEVYGKLTADPFGGGRPSFYLPKVDRKGVEQAVKDYHARNIEFNYLLNASCMANLEFSKQGQQKLRKMLDWLSEIGVDSITVGTLYFLKTIKRRYPHFKVRVSSHRYTDNARKARFWEDNGADCIVVSEVNIYREFEALRAIRESVKCDLQLIVNNSCRQDCAIAANHACSLSHASQDDEDRDRRSIPLDYSILFCLNYKLSEPINYLRANWIRPEDLHHYEAIGYENFKIVERNTPTKILLERVNAYVNRSYDGNLLDLVQFFSYDENKFSKREKDLFSLRRLLKYFMKPKAINLLKFAKVVDLGRTIGLLFPRTGEPGVYIDNKALDGFIDRFLKQGCQAMDCERCGYCQRWADKVVQIDPSYRDRALGLFANVLDELHDGSFWNSYMGTLVEPEPGRTSGFVKPYVEMVKYVAKKRSSQHPA